MEFEKTDRVEDLDRAREILRAEQVEVKTGLENQSRGRFGVAVVPVEQLASWGPKKVAELLATTEAVIGFVEGEADAEIQLALGAGAIDTVDPNMTVGVFVARVRAVTRSSSTIRGIDGLDIDAQNHLVRSVDLLDTISLDRGIFTDKERQVFYYLARNADRPVSAKELRKEIWGYADNSKTHTVETHLYRLREKLHPGDKQRVDLGIKIETIHGSGYRLMRR